MKGRDGAEPTRVFPAPPRARGARRPDATRDRTRPAASSRMPRRPPSSRAPRRPRGRQWNPFARPGLFLAVTAGTFLLGLLLGLVLGLKGH
ncbi:MAG: hypothetical protein AB1503_10470 [Bacillota bacterium]|nr:hypothetical protein [Bacillota bacterium]